MEIRVVDEQPRQGETPDPHGGVTRREALRRGAGAVGALAGAGALGTAAPAIARETARAAAAAPVTLRVLGIGVDQNPVLQAQALKDLNINLVYTITDTPTTTEKSITQPQNFDIGHLYVHQVPQILPAGVMQPIDTSKIPNWKGVAPVLTTGKLTPNPVCTTGAGDAAYRMLPLKRSNTAQLTGGSTPFAAALAQSVPSSTLISGMPGVFNVDSIGYNKQFIPKVTSWAQLFDTAYKGKVALINDPQIGPIDAALAASASGKLKFHNIGDMTTAEIDNLIKLLIDMKKTGFFRAFWSTFTESVDLMSTGEVVIESMWSPAQTILLESGKNVGFAAPKEGFRGWCGCTMIYKHVTGATLEAAYKYLNWWLSGFPGANMARQAYYSPRPDTARKFLSAAEWNYWYGGKPAATDLVGPDGKRAVPKGAIREGGSFTQRICRYSAWNTTMPQNSYMATQWNNFISA